MLYILSNAWRHRRPLVFGSGRFVTGSFLECLWLDFGLRVTGKQGAVDSMRIDSAFY